MSRVRRDENGARQRKAHLAPPTINTDLTPTTSVPSFQGTPTPRTTLGSPLTSAAAIFRGTADADHAAGPRRRHSLSEVQVLPWLCCMAPAISLFFLYGTIIITALFFHKAFYFVTCMLTFMTIGWVINLAIFSMVGGYRLRTSSHTDWHAMLEQVQANDPAEMSVMHIVILPNYLEHEKMLKETLEHIAMSPLACDRIRVVLGMEAREGKPGREKAERLIREMSPKFADVFATYHPTNVPGEVPGKSSNTQFAFREAIRHYGPQLKGKDWSRVFVTVGDADTLWHPQYFSALSYKGLCMNKSDREWRIWQPPVILARNYFTVPALTRASSGATLIFELSALANQLVFPAFAYSSYSMTLALASHPEVDGWDPDVIAEDHHMFCKCYFAALWDLEHKKKHPPMALDDVRGIEIRPRLEVDPIFLPAVSYLVEADGYWASLVARFHQARRHSQGVVELGYVLLQYARLVGHAKKLPFRTHWGIWCVAAKIHMVHITFTGQCMATVVASFVAVLPGMVVWVYAGGLSQLLSYSSGAVSYLLDGFYALGGWQQALAAAFGQISAVVVLYAFTICVVMSDLFEGKHYEVMPTRTAPDTAIREVKEVDRDVSSVSSEEMEDDAKKLARQESVQAATTAPITPAKVPAFVRGKQSWIRRFVLFLSTLSDTGLIGYLCLIIYGVIPEWLAAVSLFRRGTTFEYVVALKPEL